MKCNGCQAEGRKLTRLQGQDEWLCPSCRSLPKFRINHQQEQLSLDKKFVNHLLSRTSVGPQFHPEMY